MDLRKKTCKCLEILALVINFQVMIYCLLLNETYLNYYKRLYQ
jgi:hypothetical protein